MNLENADEGGFRPMHSPANLVGPHADTDQIAASQYVLCFRVRNHFHPCRILFQMASALCAAAGVVEIFVGHLRVNPSDAHFRVASIPILLP